MTFPDSVPMRVSGDGLEPVILQAYSTQEARLVASWKWGRDMSQEELRRLKVEVSTQALEKYHKEAG